MQKLTDGKPTVPVQGKSVREVIDNLDHAYPGVKARLVDGFKLKPNISVAVDGEVSPIGMLQRVEEDSEVHFLPAIGGGSQDEQSSPTPTSAPQDKQAASSTASSQRTRCSALNPALLETNRRASPRIPPPR